MEIMNLYPKKYVKLNEGGEKELEENAKIKKGTIQNIVGDMAIVIDQDGSRKLIDTKWLTEVK